MRVKAIGKLIVERNRCSSHPRSSSSGSTKEEQAMVDQLKPLHGFNKHKYGNSRRKGYGKELCDTPKLQITKMKDSEEQCTMQMKDIPQDQASDSSNGLYRRGNVRADDQMLELWETAENGNNVLTIGASLRMSYEMTDMDVVYNQFVNTKHSSGHPSTDSDKEKELAVDKLQISPTTNAELNKEANIRRILERLASNSNKLENLQITVKSLRRKLEISKKSRKHKTVDYETVEEQIQEAEETITQLMDLNGQLAKKMGDYPSPNGKASPHRKEAVRMRIWKLTEQARKGSERIGRLQLEVQKIQYMMLKLEEDDKKNKVRNKLFRSRSVVLRDFINNGRKCSGQRNMEPLCGCFRPSTDSNGRSKRF